LPVGPSGASHKRPPTPVPPTAAGRGERGGISGPPVVAIFRGETAPENLTGEIRRFAPTHLVILDATDLGRSPGTVALLERDADQGSAALSSHHMPMSVLIEYLCRSNGCTALIVGIQPGSVHFGREPSARIRAAARRVADALADALAGGAHDPIMGARCRRHP
jgi:hydrogenase 3 maturation protease